MNEKNENLYLRMEQTRFQGERLAFPETWDQFLRSDFSPTVFFEEQTGGPIKIEIISTIELLTVEGSDQIPEEIQRRIVKLTPPIVQRETYLCSHKNQILAYAVSWWNAEDYQEYVQNGNRTIWSNLSAHPGIKREIVDVFLIESDELKRDFQSKGPYPARQYYFNHNGKAITFIQEVFSSANSIA